MGRRSRRTPDARRIGAAVSHPGIDPRTWASSGRIDEDPDAVHFDAGVGWIVDVTLTGSGLEDDESRPCRLVSFGSAGQGRGEYLPPARGAEVLVVVPAGDIESGPVAVGYLTNEDDAHPPDTINQIPISPESPSSSDLSVSPFDTEIVSSSHHRREEYAGDRHIQAKSQIIEATETVKLAVRDALQSYVRGERFVEALNGWIDAVTKYVTKNGEADLAVYTALNLLAPGSITPDQIGAVVAAIVQSEDQRARFQAAAVAGDALSARIKGD